MMRRSKGTISILLFSFVLISCHKADTSLEGRNNNLPMEETNDTLKASSEGHILNSADAEYADIRIVIDEAEDVIEKQNIREEEEVLMENKYFTEESIKRTLNLSELLQGKSEPTNLRRIISSYPAATILDTGGVTKETLASIFYSEEISEQVKERINGKSYGDECDVPYSELRYIRALYLGFDGQTHIGEMIVNQGIAEDIIAILQELYQADYPIEQMVLVDEYNADDITSMEANNSSAFNYRRIDRSTRISLHSYGLAIDINPQYNPYVREIDGETVILPENGSDYTDRSIDNPYYIKEGDICWSAFTKRGFSWGGAWTTQKDYQHFQKKLPE
jgi:hypothetical protein